METHGAERPLSLLLMALCLLMVLPGWAMHSGPSIQFHIRSAARSSTIIGEWSKVDALPSGSSILVILRNGDEVNGQFERSSPDIVVVEDRSGERRIPKAAIQRIVSTEGDGLGNGALIGAGAGLGAALAILGIAAATKDDGEYLLPSAKLFAPILGAGIGLALGIVIDAHHANAEVLYEASTAQ